MEINLDELNHGGELHRRELYLKGYWDSLDFQTSYRKSGEVALENTQ